MRDGCHQTTFLYEYTKKEKCNMTKTKLCALLAQKNFREIRRLFAGMNPVDIARLFGELSGSDLPAAFRLLEKQKAAEVFSYMDAQGQESLLMLLSDIEIKNVLDEMFSDDTADLIEDMPANVVQRILTNLDETSRRQINELLRYPHDSAGSVMTVEYVALSPDMTVSEALEHIRRVGEECETVYTCYVTKQRKLIGTVSAKSLLLASPDESVRTITEPAAAQIQTHADREEAARMLQRYGLEALPVVDGEGCLVGIVTFDDALEVLDSETEEDMAKMAAIQPAKDSYFKTSIWAHAAHRTGWLLVLMLSATFTGLIISHYEAAFSAVPLLVSFIPMLMDTGGNCGSQSATLVIRGLAVQEIRFSDLFRVMWKEFRIALVISVILSVVNGLRILLMYRDPLMALVVGLSLAATVVLAKLVGCVLPLLAKRVGLDPAIMASPLITTIVDACSVLLYFQIATTFLPL